MKKRKEPARKTSVYLSKNNINLVLVERDKNNKNLIESKIKDVIKNDPFCKAHKEWQKALKQLAMMGKRAEQQALAKHGLNFVITDYLPKKLKDHTTWLP